MAKEYDRLAETYMVLRHEHISALVDQDSKEKNARRQVVDSRQYLANGVQKLLRNSEAAFRSGIPKRHSKHRRRLQEGSVNHPLGLTRRHRHSTQEKYQDPSHHKRHRLSSIFTRTSAFKT